MKKCSKCSIVKILDSFYKKDFYCKSCRNITTSNWNEHNKDKVSAIRKKSYLKNIDKRRLNNKVYQASNPEKMKNSKLKFRYGITLEEYNKIKLEQNNCCKICKKEENLVVDHCHKTKKVRGLLCTLCNKGLGHFKDDISLFEKVIQYIKESHVY